MNQKLKREVEQLIQEFGSIETVSGWVGWDSNKFRQSLEAGDEEFLFEIKERLTQ